MMKCQVIESAEPMSAEQLQSLFEAGWTLITTIQHNDMIYWYLSKAFIT